MLKSNIVGINGEMMPAQKPLEPLAHYADGVQMYFNNNTKIMRLVFAQFMPAAGGPEYTCAVAIPFGVAKIIRDNVNEFEMKYGKTTEEEKNIES